MIKVSNKILESILKKAESGNWDKNLTIATQKINSQVIYHLHMVSSTIFLGLELFATHFNMKLAFVPEEGIFLWVQQVIELVKHLQLVRKYYNYQFYTYDRIRQLLKKR